MPENQVSRLRIFLIYLRLGCHCFGGPVAHLAHFKDEFVSRRAWLSESKYAELLGLCQFVPGPSSSQLGFAIGWQKGGLLGACAAWLGFTLPSAILMITFAYGLFALGNSIDAAIHGLLVAAVAVVANATLGLGRKLCPDLPRVGIAIFAAALVLILPGSFTQMAVILVGALIGQKLAHHAAPENNRPDLQTISSSRTVIYSALGLYALLLAISLWIDPNQNGAIYALHYRAGALVFGGGHVVLPLLNDTIVSGGFVSESHFLAGYSAAQALPGPLFTFSAFLGTAGSATDPALIGGNLALIAIFLPGILLLIGLLPYWNHISQKAWARAGLIGANASVVGLLIAALLHPVWTNGIQSIADLFLGVLAFVALLRFKAPAWLVVLGCGIAGYLFY